LVLRKVELVFVQEWMWFCNGLMIASCECPTIEYINDFVDQNIGSCNENALKLIDKMTHF